MIGDLSEALRASWSVETAAPEDRPAWTPQNPARGQCAVTALIVHDHLGGRLVRGEVHVNDIRVDFHWWNELPDGTHVDLTRDQFAPDEIVVGAEPVDRPDTPGRFAVEYDLLRTRVEGRITPV